MELDTIYTFTENDIQYWYTTPDGVGRHWWHTLEEAQDQTGYTQVVYIIVLPFECVEKEIDGTCIHSDHTL